MRRFRVAALFLAIAVALQPPMAFAQDCASQVQSAESAAREQFISGMSGLANNNFSQRPGTFASMACLDKFMKGNMDTLFKPPQLNDLLGQVLNFACQQAKQAMSGALGSSGTGNLNLQSLIGSLAGGLNIPGAGGGSGLLNLSSLSGIGGAGTSFNANTSGIGSLFRYR